MKYYFRKKTYPLDAQDETQIADAIIGRLREEDFRSLDFLTEITEFYAENNIKMSVQDLEKYVEVCRTKLYPWHRYSLVWLPVFTPDYLKQTDTYIKLMEQAVEDQKKNDAGNC